MALVEIPAQAVRLPVKVIRDLRSGCSPWSPDAWQPSAGDPGLVGMVKPALNLSALTPELLSRVALRLLLPARNATYVLVNSSRSFHTDWADGGPRADLCKC
jgi:hypothetical protein